MSRFGEYYSFPRQPTVTKVVIEYIYSTKATALNGKRMSAFIISLVIFGVLLLLAEIILPSGVSGVMGGLCLLVAIVLGFTQSFNLGVSLLFGSMFFAAFMLWLFVRFVPDSPIGKLVFLKKSAKEWDGFETANKTLLGKTGISCTMLRPSGMAVIDDERIDVVTEGEMIQKDQPIKVIEIEGNRIVVAIDHSNDP